MKRIRIPLGWQIWALVASLLLGATGCGGNVALRAGMPSQDVLGAIGTRYPHMRQVGSMRQKMQDIRIYDLGYGKRLLMASFKRSDGTASDFGFLEPVPPEWWGFCDKALALDAISLSPVEVDVRVAQSRGIYMVWSRVLGGFAFLVLDRVIEGNPDQLPRAWYYAREADEVLLLEKGFVLRWSEKAGIDTVLSEAAFGVGERAP